jgi:hypothetical protein
MTLSEAPGELLLGYGVEQNDPLYVLRNDAVRSLQAENTTLADAITSIFKGRPTTHVFENAAPVSDERVLMLSDSFGDLAAEPFAGAFRRLVHVTTNDMKAPTSRLIERVRKLEPVDRILILMEEGNVDRIRALLK